jgi:hypothetical protein
VLIRSFRLLAAGLALGLFAAPLAGQDSRAQSLLAMRAFDQRVATIGYRLATANRDWCAQPAWLPGLELHDITQYGADWSDAARAAFGLDDDPAVLALAAGGPAARAGLRLDDHVLSLDGAPLPPAGDARPGTFDREARILAALDSAFADGTARVAATRAGAAISVEVHGVRGCPSRFQLIPSTRLNALADGRYVQVTTALADYVADDDELAAVLAHEFAHNILHHRARLDAAHVSRGLLGNFGRNARLIRATEDEADRLSVYLLDRAGYDIEAPVRFWSRFGRRGLSFLSAPTHSNWRRRIQLFEAEIARVRAAHAAGRAPAPDFVQLPVPNDG